MCSVVYKLLTVLTVLSFVTSAGFSAETEAPEIIEDSSSTHSSSTVTSSMELPTIVYDGKTPLPQEYIDGVPSTPVIHSPGVTTDIDSGMSVSSGVYPSAAKGRRVILTMPEAEMMAINYSPKFKQVLTQRIGAAAKKYGAYGSGLPSLSVDANNTWSQRSVFENDDSNSARRNLGYGVNLSQPLFTGGSIISKIKESRLYDDWVSEDIRRARLGVIKTVRLQFWLCLKSLKVMNVYSEQMEISKEYWEKTKRRYEVDDVPEIDVLKYEVDYKIQEANYIRAKSDYDIARADLLRLIGMDLDTDLELNDSFQFVEFNPGAESSLMNEAVTNRPEIKSAKLNESIQKEKIWQEKSGLFPQVSAVAGYNNNDRWSETNYARGTDWNWNAGINVSWDALAGGGQLIRSNIVAAQGILEAYKFETQDTVDGVKQEVKDSLLSFFSSVDWVKSQRENVTQAERVLSQETVKYDEGAGDYLNILDARQKLAQTQLLYWDGIYSYKTSIVNLEYSVGRFENSVDTQVRGYKVQNPKKLNAAKARKAAPMPTIEESFDSLLATPSFEKIDSKPSKSAITPPAFIEVEPEPTSPLTGPKPIY